MSLARCFAAVSLWAVGTLGWVESAWSGRYIPALNPIANQYIVILQGKSSVDGLGINQSDAEMKTQRERIISHYGAVVDAVWDDAIRGFGVTMSPIRARELANDPEIALVEEDSIVSLSATQAAAPWHLDRIDQTSLPLDNLYSFLSTGKGVNAYIIDSGIRASHTEFVGNRVKTGFTFVSDGRGTDDCLGHGTHVAGIVGGATFGVAKEVNLYPVRVFSCGGYATNQQILSAVDWVSKNHIKPAVVNMSLEGTGTALTTAVDNLVRQKGVTVVAAAGNSSVDACTSSPANVPSVITVAASSNKDARASFSNFGSCVDIFAPGLSITSAGINSNTATTVKNGTSMAAPIVTGAVSRLLQAELLTPGEIWTRLRDTSIANAISDERGSPNRLIYVAGDGAPPPTQDKTPPTANLIAPNDGETLSAEVTLAASAQDNVGIAKVEFYASNSSSNTNYKLLGSASSPTTEDNRYEIRWDSQGLSNGAYGIWAKAIDTNQNATNTPIANITIFNPALESCKSNSQNLANPGFEQGKTDWMEITSGNTPIIQKSGESQTGLWAARFRGFGKSGTDVLGQNVFVPADACSAKLDFWLKKTKPSGSSALGIRFSRDRFRIEIVRVSAPGKPVTLLREYLETELPVNTYQKARFDLSAFTGQTLEIRLSGAEDRVEATAFWLDNVELNVTR